MILVLGKDDASLQLFASEAEVARHLETIDIENEEYEFCDDMGQRFRGEIVSRIRIFSPGTFRLQPVGTPDPTIPFAFIERAQCLHGEAMGVDTLDDLRRRIQAEPRDRCEPPEKPSFPTDA